MPTQASRTHLSLEEWSRRSSWVLFLWKNRGRSADRGVGTPTGCIMLTHNSVQLHALTLLQDLTDSNPAIQQFLCWKERSLCMHYRGLNIITQQISAVFVLFSLWASPSSSSASGKLTISSHSRREMSGRRPLTCGISNFWVAQSSKLYLDDILISCRDISEHRVCQVLQTLLVSQGQYVGVHPKANSMEQTSWYLRRLCCAQVICMKGNERSVAKVAGGVPTGWFQESRSDDRQVSYHLSYSCKDTSKKD